LLFEQFYLFARFYVKCSDILVIQDYKVTCLRLLIWTVKTLQDSEFANGGKTPKRLGLRDLKLKQQKLVKTNLNHGKFIRAKNSLDDEEIGLVKP
jgi:hypothetical protein